MLDNIEKKLLANQIISNTNHQHCFLFIGKNAKEENITESICNLKWSAIIHESDNFDYAIKFAVNGKNTDSYILGQGNPIPNKQNIPFIYFSDIDPDSSQFSLYGLLKSYLKNLSHLYVIGFDLDNSLLNVFKTKDFERRISFFGIDDIAADTAKELKEKNSYEFYRELLGDVLRDSIVEYDTYTINEEANVLFFSNDMQYSIPETDLIGTHGIVTLLNRGLLENNLPVGKTDRERAFEKFLESSTSDGPQWYAYSKSANFIVERKYKKTLMAVTEAALNNRLMPDGQKYDNSNPIVLMGESASSKSIMLGSIAVDVFNAHKYPVLFIDSANISLSFDNSDEIFEKINMLMERIEQCDSDAKILLIWDCSALQINNLQISQKEAQKLNKYLINRGRRFVILYSSYEYDLSKKCRKYDFPPSNKSFRVNNNNNVQSEANLYFDAEEWIVQASRELSDDEITGIRDMFKAYGNVDPDDKFWKDLREIGADLFTYFYRLTIILHDPLKEHFAYERDHFYKYHDNKLKELFHKYKHDSVIHIDRSLLELLGIPVEEKADDEDIVNKLDNFQKCIAIFTQFYICTPRSLALSFIDDKLGKTYYSSESREIYMFAENEIPWIRTIERNGTFYFDFRSNDEARIYLEDYKGFTTPEQVDKAYLDLIIQILDQYIKLSTLSGEGDSEIVNSLIILLRQIGPNSKRKLKYWSYIQEHLDVITDKLEAIIRDGFDIYHSFELTYIIFIRENYSKKLIRIKNGDSTCDEKKLKDYMVQIKKALERCNNAIDQFKKAWVPDANGRDPKSRNICDQLINEKVHCNILLSEYNELLNGKDGAGFLSDFPTMFNEIEQIIYNNPTNGFFYNTLFKLFERWCEGKHSDLEKLRYSSHIANIIDQINSNEIYHRDITGIDELSGHKSKFQFMLANFGNIKIEKFEQRSDHRFNEIFENALPHDRASYIWLVCYNELNTKEMRCLNELQENEYDVIPDKVRERCGEIFGFIKKYYDAVKTNGSALQLMLRIFWIWKAGSELQLRGELNECRLTKFKEDEWETINTICRDYCNLTSGSNISPFMKYMYVLSMTSTQKLETPDDIQAIKRQLQEIDENSFMSLRRMYIPFVLCDKDGKPRCFTGKVTEVNGKNGKISLSNPNFKDLHFNEYNLKSKADPSSVINRTRNDLVIGIGYTRPQIYSYDYIMEKQRKRRKEKKNG